MRCNKWEFTLLPFDLVDFLLHLKKWKSLFLQSDRCLGAKRNLSVWEDQCIHFPEPFPWPTREKKNINNLPWLFLKDPSYLEGEKKHTRFVNYHLMWTNWSLYTILHLVSQKDLDNRCNLQEFALSGANAASSVGCRFSAPLWPSELFFFSFLLKLCFSFPGLERKGCLVPWTPDAIANHICPDGGGGPSAYRT